LLELAEDALGGGLLDGGGCGGHGGGRGGRGGRLVAVEGFAVHVRLGIPIHFGTGLLRAWVTRWRGPGRPGRTEGGGCTSEGLIRVDEGLSGVDRARWDVGVSNGNDRVK